MKRLTTDNPKMNVEIMLNFAYAGEDSNVHLCYDNGIDVCKYIEKKAKTKGCDITSDDIAEGICIGPDACNDCELSILYTLAVQAAELRERLKYYEDSVEQGRLIELPCKVGDTVYYISATAEKEKCKGCKFYYNGSVDMIPCCNRPDDNILHKCLGVESCTATLRDIYWWLYTSTIGKSIFLTREEAEQALKERSDNNDNCKN